MPRGLLRFDFFPLLPLALAILKNYCPATSCRHPCSAQKTTAPGDAFLVPEWWRSVCGQLWAGCLRTWYRRTTP